MIAAVSRDFHSRGKKVIVVLNICGPVEVASWRDKVDAILVAWLPGQEAGNSISDALLGAAALGDIGKHFPDTDPAYKGAASLALTRHVGSLLKEHGYRIINVDSTVIAQRPKLAPHIELMRTRIADTLDISINDVNVKATTEEKLGFTGDAQVFADAALYLMDCLPVYARWLREVAASQFENGCIPNVVPRNNFKQTLEPVGKDGSAGWCNAFEIVTHRIMERYDSTYLAQELYPSLKRWVQYNLEKAREYRPENESIPEIYRDYILDCANNWGEWNEPGRGPKDYFAELKTTGHHRPG